MTEWTTNMTEVTWEMVASQGLYALNGLCDQHNCVYVGTGVQPIPRWFAPEAFRPRSSEMIRLRRFFVLKTIRLPTIFIFFWERKKSFCRIKFKWYISINFLFFWRKKIYFCRIKFDWIRLIIDKYKRWLILLLIKWLQ